MAKEIRACLVGISGYAGMELARLLVSHPAIELCMACSRAEAGKKLGDFYPFLRGLPGSEVIISVYSAEEAASRADLVFLAVPAGTALDMAPDLLGLGLKVIDFSADFRLADPEVYSAWYGREHQALPELQKAVYGLPELYGPEIANASLVANPGCYPTASILALYPALKNNLIDTSTIIIDAKSGASGAGRKAAVPTLFCEISDNFRAYGIPRHRHTPEIEQELSKISGEPIKLNFTPHIVPMKRGILATIYSQLHDPLLSANDIRQIYSESWKGYPWIRIMPDGSLPETANVHGSMYCDIALVKDERTGRLIILSAIDNLCRGAAGQALASANLMFGLPVETGMAAMAPLP